MMITVSSNVASLLRQRDRLAVTSWTRDIVTHFEHL
jgi:hypothetical protein